MAATATSGPDLGKPQFESHKWIEPIIVITIMVSSLIVNRHKGFSISRPQRRSQNRPLLGEQDSESDGFDADICQRSSTGSNVPGQGNRYCRRWAVPVLNNRRFRNNVHSRLLQKFPFLIEMFYWALNYGVYSLTKTMAAEFYDGKGNGVVELAQSHGISILWFEHDSVAKFLFPVKEVNVQKFFLDGHSSAMTVLNRAYSLVHIPATVLFLSWYYRVASSHEIFAIARRTMTLANFAAFFIFSLWPCMPPRLLPKSYGFHDTVRQGKAESVWVGGKNVNQLAAMPSLHFTYASITGVTLLYHSRRQRLAWKLFFILAGIFYPAFVMLVIVATANHYYLDAVVATFTVTLSFLCNRVWLVLLPVEDWLCWLLRLEKPQPTTGLAGPERRTKGRISVV